MEGYAIEYRFGGSLYAITVRNEDGVTTAASMVTVDGRVSSDGGIQLVYDGARHEVTVHRVRSETRGKR